ncbi:MAG TPA: flagellar motor switch protein FliG [Oligoflexia bacterium]|nr:flagellar motor switch protein FliG [Oligoflexia bacterium]HMP47583.1 flagellar motor switch protein FliG [Oligoflexia bacterium]
MALETNNLTKAAVILMSLGKDLAAEVMKFLTETEVKKLSRAFMSVHEVDRESQRTIANEFSAMLRASDTVVVDGREFAKDVIGSAFGSDTGDSLLEYITGSRKEPLSTLINDIPGNIVDNFIQSEHPQTIAFLMTRMTPDMAAELLGKMNKELQTDVLIRVAQLEHVKSDVVDEVREVLRSQLRGVSMGEEEEVGGAKTTADILNFVERNNEERILAEIEEAFPELADEIRNLMFTFEDVGKIDDKSIQTILKEVPRDQLVLALKTASADLRDLLFRNISQRAAEMLQDDLESLGPTPLKEVEKAQQAIVDVVRRLEAEGKITISAGGDDVLV